MKYLLFILYFINSLIQSLDLNMKQKNKNNSKK